MDPREAIAKSGFPNHRDMDWKQLTAWGSRLIGIGVAPQPTMPMLVITRTTRSLCLRAAGRTVARMGQAVLTAPEELRDYLIRYLCDLLPFKICVHEIIARFAPPGRRIT